MDFLGTDAQQVQVHGPWTVGGPGTGVATVLAQVCVSDRDAVLVLTEMRHWPGADPVGDVDVDTRLLDAALARCAVRREGGRTLCRIVRQGPFSTYDPTTQSFSEILGGADGGAGRGRCRTSTSSDAMRRSGWR